MAGGVGSHLQRGVTDPMPEAPPESRVGGKSGGYVSGSCPLDVDSNQGQLTKCGITGSGVAGAADDWLG